MNSLKEHSGILNAIVRLTHQNPSQCYQCGKCSAGCPLRNYVESSPNRIIRLVQLGMYEKALTSPMIWMCAGCLTCSTRCPQNFDLAGFMDAMREIAIRLRIKPSDPNVIKFHHAFLNQVRRHGRLYEMGLIRDFKMSSMHFFQDLDVAPAMLLKGKIGLMPHKIKNREAVRRIFRNVEKLERSEI